FSPFFVAGRKRLRALLCGKAVLQGILVIRTHLAAVDLYWHTPAQDRLSARLCFTVRFQLRRSRAFRETVLARVSEVQAEDRRHPQAAPVWKPLESGKARTSACT